MRFARAASVRGVPALASFVAAGVLSIGVVSPPEHCPAVTESQLRAAASDAVGWLVRNQLDDGSFLYEYDADRGRSLGGYNAVRHAGVVMSLYTADRYGIDGAVDAADRGLEWARSRLARGEGWIAAGASADEPSVGASALLLAGLAERRDSLHDDRFDDLMRGLATFLAGQIEPSGAITNRYDVATGKAVPGEHSKYATGEAYWALAQMARQFPDEPWGDRADRVGAYIAGVRDAAEDMRRTRDHWAAYGLSETVASGSAHDRALTPAEMRYARHQAEILGTIVRWMSQQAGPWGIAVRGPALQRGGAYGTIGEALTRLWRVAGAEPSLADLRDPIGWRALCNASLTIAHQVDAEQAEAATDPERVRGAWVYGGTTRMDDQQHALSSLLQAIDIVRAGAPEEDDGWGGQRPSVVVWVLVLVAAVNPARLARAHGRRRPDPRALVVVAALVACAILSGPLLGWLDVSRPGFRASAGVLGIVAGAVALFRGPSARSGTTAASLSAPAIALTIAAAADRGVLTVLAAIAVAAAATTVVTLLDRPVPHLERAVDGALVVLAALVTVAGVMAV